MRQKMSTKWFFELRLMSIAAEKWTKKQNFWFTVMHNILVSSLTVMLLLLRKIGTIFMNPNQRRISFSTRIVVSLFVKNDDWKWTWNLIICHRFGIFLCPFLYDVCNVIEIGIFIPILFVSILILGTHFSLDFNSSIKASYVCFSGIDDWDETFTGHNARRFSTKSLKQFELSIRNAFERIISNFRFVYDSRE